MSTEIRQRQIAEAAPLHGSGTKWFWSPAVHWRAEGDSVKAGEVLFDGFARGLFPDIYFLTQTGTTIAQIEAAFPTVPGAELRQALNRLIESRALVSGLLSPAESFSAQAALFPHEYGEALLYDPKAYEGFKSEQLKRKPPVRGAATIKLEPGNWEIPAALVNRRSQREFSQEPLSISAFARALSAFRRWSGNGHERALYPSTGGLYGVDVYLHVRSGRVENVPGGVYFYNPRECALHPCAAETAFTRDFYHHQNRPIFNSAAFTVMFVFNPEVTFPVYGASAYYLGNIETGIMLGTFNHIAELQGIGLCPIGLIDSESAGLAIGLNPQHKILHVAECGGKHSLGTPLSTGALSSERDARPAETSEPPKPAAAETAAGVTVSELRRFLSERLPEYMVPSEFVLIENVPLTPNNKVDREALLKMNGTGALELGTEYVEAHNDLEQTLVGLWRKVIRAERIGVDDNFFDLGGDSMGVAEVHRQVQAQFAIEVPIVKFFQHPTIRALAAFLKGAIPAGVHPGNAVPGQKLPIEPQRDSLQASPVKRAGEIAPMDRQALDWLRANPSHPQAQAVAQKLRSRGVSV